METDSNVYKIIVTYYTTLIHPPVSTSNTEDVEGIPLEISVLDRLVQVLHDPAQDVPVLGVRLEHGVEELLVGEETEDAVDSRQRFVRQVAGNDEPQAGVGFVQCCHQVVAVVTEVHLVEGYYCHFGHLEFVLEALRLF